MNQQIPKEPTQTTEKHNSHLAELPRGAVLADLRRSPSIRTDDLLSDRMTGRNEGRNMPRYNEVLGKPIEGSQSPKTRVDQDLMAVIGLGAETGLGVITARTADGLEMSFLTVMTDNPIDKERARFLATLKPGRPVTVGRDMFDHVPDGTIDRNGISTTHCSVEYTDGVLTVTDLNSTNGTSVMTNESESTTQQFRTVETWAPDSGSIKDQIETAAVEQMRVRVIPAVKLGAAAINPY